MADFKVDYFFDSKARPGWTETFYGTSDTIEAALELFTGQQLGYTLARREVLHKANFLTEIRVSNVAVRGDSLVKVYSGDTGRGLYDKGDADQVWDGILFRGEAGSLTRRAVHLRGVPAGNMDSTGLLTILPDFLQPMTNWQLLIGNLASSFKIRKRTKTVIERPTQCNLIGAGRSIQLVWGVARPGGVAVNTTITVSKIQDANDVNGLWKVASVDATSANMFPKRTVMYGDPNTAIAEVATLVISYPAITKCIAERGVRIKTGKSSAA